MRHILLYVCPARRVRLSPVLLIAGVLSFSGLAACGGGGSPTAATPPPQGAIAVSVAPNPVPFSGAPSPQAACAGSGNTWRWIYGIRETGGANVTITERIHFLDGTEVGREPGFTLAANGTLQQESWTCVADAKAAHTFSTRFVGTDANNNAFTYNVPAFQLLARSPFTTVSLEPIANAATGHLSPRVEGPRTFVGIPYDMGTGPRTSFITQHVGHPELPTEATLSLSAGSATHVHLLLTGAYVVAVPAGRRVGDITLSFANGATLTVPVVSWSNIREDWHYVDDPPRTMTPPVPPVTWVNVFEQSQRRGDRPAIAVLDRFTIEIPSNLTSVPISSLRVRDTSQTTAQSISPSLSLAAVTLESR